MSTQTYQTYQTHRYTPRLTAAAFLSVLVALVAFGLRWFDLGGRLTFAIGLGGLIACNLVLIAISRVYITRLQDRIIRLEMKVRVGALLSPAQQAVLAGLSLKHIAAIRFASDEELPELLDRSQREHLSPEQIKQAIKHWVPDWART